MEQEVVKGLDSYAIVPGTGHKGLDACDVRRMLPSELAEMELPAGTCRRDEMSCPLCEEIRLWSQVAILLDADRARVFREPRDL